MACAEVGHPWGGRNHGRSLSTGYTKKHRGAEKTQYGDLKTDLLDPDLPHHPSPCRMNVEKLYKPWQRGGETRNDGRLDEI